MSARLVNGMKKWWLIALVFALALSLTSCAKKRAQLMEGMGYCDTSGNPSIQALGEMDVYVRPVTGQQNRFELIIVPINLVQPGDVVDIHVVNSSTFQYLPMIRSVSLANEQPLIAGTLSLADLDNYDRLAITYYQPGLDFLSILRGTNPPRANICELPYLGDNLTN